MTSKTVVKYIYNCLLFKLKCILIARELELFTGIYLNATKSLDLELGLHPLPLPPLDQIDTFICF